MPSSLNSEQCLSSVPVLNDYTETIPVWITILLTCVTASYALTISGLVQQYRISKDFEARQAEYTGFEQMLKDLYPWEKAAKSLEFNKQLFKFLILRTCLAEFTFDFCFMLLFGPAYLWQFYIGRFIEWDWCGMVPFNIEMVATLFCLITWKTAKILFLTPWTAYQMWCIEKKFELAEPTICSFIWERIAILIEFLFIHLPLTLLIVLVIEWSGDYLVLAFFLATAIVKLILCYVHPLLIDPLTSSTE